MIFAMLQISKRSQYGLYVLLTLAKSEGKRLSIREIAKKLGLPYRFLSQIASELKSNHLIESKEGREGGYFLRKKPRDISLLKIVETLDSDLGLIDCQLGKVCSNLDNCGFKKTWDKVRDSIALDLKKYTLQNFLH